LKASADIQNLNHGHNNPNVHRQSILKNVRSG
jgi:hypothetical protein